MMVGIFKIRPPGEAMHFEAESNWFMQLFWGESCGRDRGLLHHLQGIMAEHHLQGSQVIIYFKLYSFDSFYFCLKLKYLIICNNLFFKMLYQNNYFMTNKFKHLFLII